MLASASHWPLRTTRTATMPGPHAVFSYGSNGMAQLRDRCKNPEISGIPAILPDAVRIFAGTSKRWADGGVASVIPKPGSEVLGNVAMLSSEELKLLDVFECGPGIEDPYSQDGSYRRQDIRVKAGTSKEDLEDLDAVVYIKNDITWVAMPSQGYMDACLRNVLEFWPGASVEVRDETGELRGGE